MEFTVVQEGKFVIDLLAQRAELNKCFVGLVVETFLTISFEKGQAGPAGAAQNGTQSQPPDKKMRISLGSSSPQPIPPGLTISLTASKTRGTIDPIFF